jgi:hypothetical protein
LERLLSLAKCFVGYVTALTVFKTAICVASSNVAINGWQVELNLKAKSNELIKAQLHHVLGMTT